MRKFLFAVACLAVPAAVSAQEPNNVDPGITRDSVGAFVKVDTEAEFPGGLPAWKQFLYTNLNPESIVKVLPKKTKHFQQTARVQFIVCTDGTVCNVRVVNDVLPEVRAEAERVIRQSGNWQPAEQNGRKVKAYRVQPITFVVTD